MLDLDETIIHCSRWKFDKEFDFKISVLDEFGQTNKVGYLDQAKIYVRPHLQQFLDEVSKDFEIIIFTASGEDYANKILDIIDRKSSLE